MVMDLHTTTTETPIDAGTRLGEVVAVSTSEFTAQSYELEIAPPYGSLVRVGKPDGPRHYAFCYTVSTGSIEPGRTAVAWGRHEDDETDIFRHQPQLAQILQTTWTCLLVGDARGMVGTPLVQRIPSTPPRLHSFVYTATTPEIRLFQRDLGYVRFLLRSGVPNADDLVAASIALAVQQIGDRALLLQAGRLLARLLSRDHDRLMTILALLDTTLTPTRYTSIQRGE